MHLWTEAVKNLLAPGPYLAPSGLYFILQEYLPRYGGGSKTGDLATGYQLRVWHLTTASGYQMFWPQATRGPGPRSPQTLIFFLLFLPVLGPAGIPEASQSWWEPSWLNISPNRPIWTSFSQFQLFSCIFQLSVARKFVVVAHQNRLIN